MKHLSCLWKKSVSKVCVSQQVFWQIGSGVTNQWNVFWNDNIYGACFLGHQLKLKWQLKIKLKLKWQYILGFANWNENDNIKVNQNWNDDIYGACCVRHQLKWPVEAGQWVLVASSNNSRWKWGHGYLTSFAS